VIKTHSNESSQNNNQTQFTCIKNKNPNTLADAILDRLTADAQRIELKGESVRRKKGQTYQ